MRSVTHLQGRYEINRGLAEPWLLYVCNSHYEVNKQNHNSSNAEVFPETRGLTHLSTLCCSICCQSKTLYNQNLCSLHSINILDRNCQIPCNSVSTAGYLHFTHSSILCNLRPRMTVLCAKAVQGQLPCQEPFKFLQSLNDSFPHTLSCRKYMKPWIQKLVCEMAGWSIAIEQPTSLKFQFPPQRCDRQNLNERLFIFFFKVMKFITRRTYSIQKSKIVAQ